MMTREVGRTEKRKKAKTLFQDWTSWTNAKGILTNCGQAFGQYDNWEYFCVSEIQQFIGLIILNGISISPQMEYKFKTQQEDPVNGNDLCALVFGANGEKRYRQFRSLFAIQDPMIQTPDRKYAPNHKVNPLLLHML